MFTSIRAKLGVIFAGFLLVGAGSVTTTFVAVTDQAADAQVISLAGRQQMLIQEMTKAVLGLARGSAPDYQAELSETAYLFDRTLTALLDGGPAPYGEEAVTLPPTTDPAIRAQLEVVAGLWGRFRQDVQTIQTSEPGSPAFTQAVHGIETLSLLVRQEMEQAVRLYEAADKLKLVRLYVIQALFFAGAVGLLITAYLLTQRTIVNPISALGSATRRIAGGDLESSIAAESAASAEIRALAQSFERMRHELAASRLELERWAAELETRVERRTQQLAALLEVSAEISSKLEIQRVLESVVDKARHLTGSEVAVLCLLGPAEEALTVAATSGPAEALAAGPQAVIRGPMLQVARAEETTILPTDCDCGLLRPRFRRSHLAVPLHAGDRTLGVLCVGHPDEARFGEEEARLLTLLANAGAIALENARLYEQVGQAATLAERERIVAEIHDGLAQTLSFLSVRLSAVEGQTRNEDLAGVLEQLPLLQRTVRQTNDEVRRMMVGLQSPAHVRRTLEERLRQVVKTFVEEQGMAVDLHVTPGQPIGEPPEICEQVVRVVQEALTNAHKHAAGSRVTVTLAQDDTQAQVRIQDDGPGFNVPAPASEQHHFGLKVMAARAQRIHGDLRVESVPGQGTTITLRWPKARGEDRRRADAGAAGR